MTTKKNTSRHHHHRSTLSQSNKPFKSGRHASKRTIKGKLKQRILQTIQQIKSNVVQKSKGEDGSMIKKSSKFSSVSNQLKRKTKTKQQILKKNALLKSKQSLYSGNFTKLVGLIPLCSDIHLEKTVLQFGQTLNMDFVFPTTGPCILPTPVKNQRLQFLLPTSRTLSSSLEVALLADYVVFVVSAQEEVDTEGEQTLSAICAQGVPTVHCVVQHMETVPLKSHPSIRKALLSYMLDWFPSIQRIFSLHLPTECLHLVRQISETCPESLSWRDKYAYLLVASGHWEENKENNEMGTWTITGWVRGNSLSPNRLIHLPGYGDYRILNITTVPKHDKDLSLSYAPDSDADDVHSMNEENTMLNEQTWPTDQELAIADQNAKQRVLRVPKGTSMYQATWLSGSEEEGEEEGENKMEIDNLLSCGMENMELSFSHPSTAFRHTPLGRSLEEKDNQEEEEEEEEEKEVLVEEEDALEDHQASLEYAAHFASRLQEKSNQAHLEEAEEETDEVDVLPNQLARVRYQRYRGLQSFRHSSWDPNENLPIHYGRLFQLPHFRTTRRHLIHHSSNAPIAMGTHVKIVLEHVPKKVQFHLPPWVVALLPFEHQYAEMHYRVTAKRTLYSKQPLRLQVGFRTFELDHPLFSESEIQPNHCSRYLRSVSEKQTCVLTVLGPITLLGPVLLFDPQGTTLVASGTLTSPPRLLLKRIRLIGTPTKLHKKVAIIRWMFGNAMDVHWFQSVQLHTQLGRVGHIRESLGTHGAMKCSFDLPLKQNDRVYLPLYKRVFPKSLTKLLWVDGGRYKNTSANECSSR